MDLENEKLAPQLMNAQTLDQLENGVKEVKERLGELVNKYSGKNPLKLTENEKEYFNQLPKENSQFFSRISFHGTNKYSAQVNLDAFRRFLLTYDEAKVKFSF